MSLLLPVSRVFQLESSIPTDRPTLFKGDCDDEGTLFSLSTLNITYAFFYPSFLPLIDFQYECRIHQLHADHLASEGKRSIDCDVGLPLPQ